jgi:hypothetical protein
LRNFTSGDKPIIGRGDCHGDGGGAGCGPARAVDIKNQEENFMPIGSLSVHLDVFTRKPRGLLPYVILLALIPRLYLLPVMGHFGDLYHHYTISQYIIEHGIFKMYDEPVYLVNHPPIGVGLYAGSTWVWHVLAGRDIKDLFVLSDGGQIAALKYPSVMFELALIALIFEIVLSEANAAWATATALLFGFSPGHLEAVSGMGQTDSIYTFFLVLTLFLIRKRHPHWAWVAYAVAWLSKFQSIMILPITIVWTWRRYGARTLFLNLLLFVIIIGTVMTPFVVNSGQAALAPYIQGAVNQAPFITNGSYNLWYWVSHATTWTRVPDSTELVWGISYFEAGLILFSLVTGLLCLRVWLVPERDDEFLVAAAAGIAFFVLPTQIQSRYIYAGLAFLTLALRQAPWLFPVYIGFTFNFGQNVLDTMRRGSDQIAFSTANLPWDQALNAASNTLFFVILLAYALWPLWTLRIELPQRARDSLRLKSLAAGGTALLLTSLILFLSINLVPAKLSTGDLRYVPRYQTSFEDTFEWLWARIEPGDVIFLDPSCTTDADKCGRPEEWDYYQIVYFPDRRLHIVSNIDETVGVRRVWYVSVDGWNDETLQDRVAAGRLRSQFVGPWDFLWQLYEAPPDPVGVLYDNGMRFHGFDIIDPRLHNGYVEGPVVRREGKQVILRLWWSVDKPLANDYSISTLIAAAPDAPPLAQFDGPPQTISLFLYDSAPPRETSQWQPGQFYVEERVLQLPKEVDSALRNHPLGIYLTLYQWWDGATINAPGVNETGRLKLREMFVLTYN